MNESRNTLEYAGFTKRLKAFAFDYPPISGIIILSAVAAITLTKITGLFGLPLRWPENPLLADLMAFITLIFPVILYFALQESSPRQATWGKRKAGILVVNTNGGTLTKGQAFVRSFVKFLPWQIAHTCIFHVEGWPLQAVTPSPVVMAGFGLVYGLVGIYIFSALISKKHRTPYDWVASSSVIVRN